VDQRQRVTPPNPYSSPAGPRTGAPNPRAPRLGPRAFSISLVNSLRGSFVWGLCHWSFIPQRGTRAVHWGPGLLFSSFDGLTVGLWNPDHEPVASSTVAFVSRTLCNVPRSFRCWKGFSEGNERCYRCTRGSDCAATRIIAFAKVQRREFSIPKITSGGKNIAYQFW
jgi:hypothetical protein